MATDVLAAGRHRKKRETVPFGKEKATSGLKHPHLSSAQFESPRGDKQRIETREREERITRRNK